MTMVLRSCTAMVRAGLRCVSPPSLVHTNLHVRYLVTTASNSYKDAKPQQILNSSSF